MTEIGIGIVGGGYMGKAHAVAMTAVGAGFNTALRPRFEMVCASSPASQFACKLIAKGGMGAITLFRGEHTEEFLADPNTPANWRTNAIETGTPVWPTFEDDMIVNQVVAAAHNSSQTKSWINVADV